jgi:DNA-binding SARP family transcriptional activator/tetratricopeptide (TPR) repeat protein
LCERLPFGMASVSQGASPRELRVRLLGGFAVDGVDEHSLGSRKSRMLLRRLAAALGQPVSVDALFEVVWGEEQPSDPNAQLSVLVSRLRSVLGTERLVRSDLGYALAADQYDVTALRGHVEEVEARLGSGEFAAALAAGRAAMSLASGPLLPEEDAEWAAAARAETDRLTGRALRATGEAALAFGQPEAARAAGLSAIDQDPYDEAALRLVMRADALAGRPGSALAAYASMRQRLAEDLGVDPDQQTRDLHLLLVQGGLGPSTPRVTATADQVVGRSGQMGELDRLLARVTAGGVELAVVDGEAGLGKSTLLSTWAASARSRALVVAGACDELGGDVPLQPLFDGLSAHLASVGQRAAADLLGPELTLLAPYLVRVESPALAMPHATTVGDSDQGRFALFSALARVLARCAGDRPLVLVVDDLHRAAAGTLEFLTFATRRLDRLLVVVARRPQPGPELVGAVKIPLTTLTIDDVALLTGRDRAADLLGRSGGNPLFLRELTLAPDGDALPDTIVTSVRTRLETLGRAAATAEAAAACGTEVDVELVAAVVEQPVPLVLDDLERLTSAGLLRPRSGTLAFAHELVRDAIETGLSAPRRISVHRAAMTALSARPHADPLAMARHARLAGAPDVAATALTQAAERAGRRYESATALQLLDESIGLTDTVDARLLRGPLRLAALDLDGARDDARSAIDLGAGVRGFELAGWVAYYSRDYETALRYADEGVARGGDDELRASCLSLAGRIRHTRGELTRAGEELDRAVALAPAGVRAVAQVWSGQLHAHLGDVDEAVELARRGVLDPHLGHPFAAAHGYFTLSYALAIGGRWADAWAGAADLDALIERTGNRRFRPVAANLRGWLLRGAAQVEQSAEQHRRAVEDAPGPTFQEAQFAALLDLAECALVTGDDEAAETALARCAGIGEWTGSMQWRHHDRYRLLDARLRAAAGGGSDLADAADAARTLAGEAARRGDRRYAARAGLFACAFEARGGRAPSSEDLAVAVAAFVPLAGPDGWRDLAYAATATGSHPARTVAEQIAYGVVRQVRELSRPVPGLDPEAVARDVRDQLERSRA